MEAYIQVHEADSMDYGALAMKNLGLGILSWYGYDTLVHSLDSFVEGGILDLFEEKVIYFQEIDDDARSIAAKYGFEAIGTSENLGIYGGFRGLSESMTSKYVLLLENDFSLIKSCEDATRQLSIGLDLLESGRAVKVHYRDRHEYENEYDEKKISKFHRFFPSSGSSILQRLFSFFVRLFSFSRFRDYVSLSMFLFRRPQDYFDFVDYDEELDFLFYPTSYYRWSNWSFMIERTFFLEEILSRVESVHTPIGSLVNGFKCIEWEMNRAHDVPLFLRRLGVPWWNRQDYKIATPESGLFLHDRIDNRGY